MIYSIGIPGRREIGAEQNLADAGRGNQMSQSFSRHDDRIKIKLLQIFARLFLDGLA